MRPLTLTASANADALHKNLIVLNAGIICGTYINYIYETYCNLYFVIPFNTSKRRRHEKAKASSKPKKTTVEFDQDNMGSNHTYYIRSFPTIQKSSYVLGHRRKEACGINFR